ncbi:type 2 isopentenyl-diphosphate Delta-isomerase [Rossellomorea aquimaris]|uniref:type 2 isopentenyl-diphosphate Delta-isomerase n=1 Tax=Rossellomorea aquimaris TaxID=189382 RepID=UPI0011E8FE8E|nr:type 2 isopentenyl-diphosphate Delta-isomerase [Rossellomorea aquimaris]TYS87386.1 type 2 isopentenyl-diphosphate Delta-isomerase [Rossellomorea aquimaris]
MTRAQRKQDHINYALSTGQQRRTGFDEVAFVHQSLPNIAVDEIHLQAEIGELIWSSPIFINAMTGGGGESTSKINEELAILARETGLAIAVGSQMSALKDPSERKTYEIVRKHNPNGIVFGNLGSEATVQQARDAVEMISANALQIHLNVIQELTMPEGDRDFRGAMDRIQEIAESIPVPVIVKETGFGISKETAESLSHSNISAIDVGGFGGTNFSKIENQRRKRMLEFFDDWGIPTAISIAENHATSRKPILASGGVQNSLDIVKSLGLGASGVGMAGIILKQLLDSGLMDTIEEVNQIHTDIKFLMSALGCRRLEDLHRVPLVLSGDVFHWLDVRGLNPGSYSNRTFNK